MTLSNKVTTIQCGQFCLDWNSGTLKLELELWNSGLEQFCLDWKVKLSTYCRSNRGLKTTATKFSMGLTVSHKVMSNKRENFLRSNAIKQRLASNG